MSIIFADINDEIKANFPQIKSFKEHYKSHYDGKFFVTLTSSGVKKEAKLYAYYLCTMECALDHYNKHLYDFIKSSIDDPNSDYEIVWRMVPHLERGSSQLIISEPDAEGKIIVKEGSEYWWVTSRLIINKISK